MVLQIPLQYEFLYMPEIYYDFLECSVRDPLRHVTAGSDAEEFSADEGICWCVLIIRLKVVVIRGFTTGITWLLGLARMDR